MTYEELLAGRKRAKWLHLAFIAAIALSGAAIKFKWPAAAPLFCLSLLLGVIAFFVQFRYYHSVRSHKIELESLKPKQPWER